MIPTVEDILKAFPPRTVDREKAVAIHDLMEGSVTPPRALCAINEILDAHGVEAISLETAPYDRYGGQVVAEYVNMGDSYIATITRDRAGVWRVEGYGDALERAERKYGAAEGAES
jgi:hypothetical protein